MQLDPKVSSARYTIPHLETVAGLACSRESTSKSIFMFSVSLILYPFERHKILESSKTEFMFSIQRASTGPSKQIHFWLLSSFAVACLM